MLDELNQIYLNIRTIFRPDIRIVYLTKSKYSRGDKRFYYLDSTFDAGVIMITENMYNLLFKYKEEASLDVIRITKIKSLIILERNKKLGKVC